MLSYLKPYITSIFYIILLTFGQVITDLLLPNFMAGIVNEGITQNNTDMIVHSGFIMLGISLLGIICAIIAGFLASRVALGIGRDIRSSLFTHVSGYSLSEFDKIETSSLITRTTNDVQQIQTSTFLTLRMMLRAPLMCLGAIAMALGNDKKLSLVVLSILPLVFLVVFIIMRKSIPLFRSIQKKIDTLNLVMRENLIGIRIVRAFSRIGFEKTRFATANEDLSNTSIRVNRIIAILNPSIVFFMNLLMVAIVWVASFQIDNNELMVGDMMAFIQYAMQIFMSLMMITMMFIIIPRAYASAERINEVLQLNTTIKDPENPVSTNANQSFATVTFQNVTFRYDKAEIPSVNNVSFTANLGEVLAIIGGTGSGKSSLVNLIPRHYDVESGAILLNGIDIRQLSLYDLRKQIGFVPQKSVLFSGTINKNIRMGKLDASDDEIQQACQTAQASEFIEQMPEKYESLISQGGTNLSGGQKQRLSIARAMVKKPHVYIFDDSFSALDFKTDTALQNALREKTRNATVIIVAQRIASILRADRILVMDQGSIIGIGSHKELLASNEIYREIVLSQLGEEKTEQSHGKGE